MVDKLQLYREAHPPLTSTNTKWQLYGTGMEYFGKEDRPVTEISPNFGPGNLLVRHDAVGLCAADVKLIRLGQQHPRIAQDLSKEPVVVGHEVTLTVIGVGENLKDKFKPGDRFIVQPDIYKNGIGYGYGFAIDGGLSEYSVIDSRVLDGDAGCYLLPIRATTGYAESALTEALAAVTAAYRLTFRATFKPQGVTWIIGTTDAKPIYTISTGFDNDSYPAKLLLTNVPEEFGIYLKQKAARLGVVVEEVSDVKNPPAELIDDIVLLGGDPDLIEQVCPRLAYTGVLSVMADRPVSRKVKLDMGRVHYERWVFTGAATTDISDAYLKPAARSTLKPAGKVWFMGSGGPIGRMHVQRAVQLKDGPKAILCTDLSKERVEVLEKTNTKECNERSIRFQTLTRDQADYDQQLTAFAGEGFDDIIVCAPSADAIAEALPHLASGGVINIFAGVAKNTFVEFDYSPSFLKGVRVIGFSGSTVEDMQITLDLIEAGEFAPNRLVAAIGSIEAAKDGLKAVQTSRFPGKIVIYNHIKELELTPIPELKTRLPSVYAKLKDGVEWTQAAETELLRLMLK